MNVSFNLIHFLTYSVECTGAPSVSICLITTRFRKMYSEIQEDKCIDNDKKIILKRFE